jgi:hypothetical protein
MKYINTILLIIASCLFVIAQVSTTPNLGLTLPPKGTQNYDVILNNNFTIIDTAVGTLQNAYTGLWVSTFTYSKGQMATYNGNLYFSSTNSNTGNVPSTSPTSWSLMLSASGSVTSIGDLPVLFTVSNRTTSATFNPTAVAQNTVLAGQASGGTGAYSFRVLTSADLPAVITSNTTGNAATSTAFSAIPTKCAAGNYPLGIDSQGNAVSCSAATGGGGQLPATKANVVNQWFNSYDSTTGLFTSTQPGFGNLSGTATAGQLPGTVVYNNQTNTYGAGFKQVFSSSASTAGTNHSGVSADPSTLVNGDTWYRTDTGRFMIRAGGVTQQMSFLSDIPAPGTAGNYQRSNGTVWTSSAIQASDVGFAELLANKNVAGGYAGIDANKTIGGPNNNLQSTGIAQTSSTPISSANCTTGCTTITAFTLNPGGVQQLHAGELVEINSMGVLSDTGTPTLALKFAATGITTLGQGPTLTLASGVTNVPWSCVSYLLVVSVSTTYSMETHGHCVINGVDADYGNAGPNTAISSSTATTLAFSPTWSVASASNTITTRVQFVRFYN